MTSTEKKNRKEKKSPSTFKKVIQKEKIIPEKSLTLKSEQLNARYLKIQPHYRNLQEGQSIVPELRLNGRWMEEAGFVPEEYVNIIVMDGLLIIRPIETKQI